MSKLPAHHAHLPLCKNTEGRFGLMALSLERSARAYDQRDYWIAAAYAREALMTANAAQEHYETDASDATADKYTYYRATAQKAFDDAMIEVQAEMQF